MSPPHPFLPELGRALVLASRSPRRADILRAQGLDFSIEPAEIDESLLANESPEGHVERLAVEKARTIAGRKPELICLGSDTVVDVDGEILGKPRDQGEASAMLHRLAGRGHVVHSAVALICSEIGFVGSGKAHSRVRFRALGKSEIDRYVRTGEPLDKAGAYGIQGCGAMLVESIEGCYFNVMGLPLGALRLVWLNLAHALGKEIVT